MAIPSSSDQWNKCESQFVKQDQIACLPTGVCDTGTAAIRFDTFSGAKGIEMAGSSLIEGNVLRLTSAEHNKSGAGWLVEKQPILSKYATTFQFQLTQFCWFGGADGLAFVIQNSGPAALGGRGSAGGFGVADGMYRNQPSISWSFAVFFDIGKTATKVILQTTTLPYGAQAVPGKCVGQRTG